MKTTKPNTEMVATFGARCAEYEPGCPTCEAWKLYDATSEMPEQSAVDARVRRARLTDHAGVYRNEDDKRSKRRWTIIVVDSDGIDAEEIDVDATSAREAKQMASDIIACDYEKCTAGRVIGPRVGLYM